MEKGPPQFELWIQIEVSHDDWAKPDVFLDVGQLGVKTNAGIGARAQPGAGQQNKTAEAYQPQ